MVGPRLEQRCFRGRGWGAGQRMSLGKNVLIGSSEPTVINHWNNDSDFPEENRSSTGDYKYQLQLEVCGTHSSKKK